MQVNIKDLLDEAQCYDTVRELRWPEGRQCPFCESKHVVRRGFDDRESARQRYECIACKKRFDDLTGTIFAGHHQPLKVWILCLYLMGLNLSNEQIAQELELDRADVQQMTSQLREGVVKKQLLQNLIGNTFKFTSPGIAPRIRVYACAGQDPSTEANQCDEQVQLFIEDHGIGFEAKHLDRIFNVFQRLEGRSAYEGAGMGLAICRKIAERHGGSITAHSQPGRGPRS